MRTTALRYMPMQQTASYVAAASIPHPSTTSNDPLTILSLQRRALHLEHSNAIDPRLAHHFDLPSSILDYADKSYDVAPG
jgi:hypothetical protein